MSRTEPEMPSIRTPLAHENTLTKIASNDAPDPRRARTLDHQPQPDPLIGRNQPRIVTTLHTETNGLSATGVHALETEDPDRELRLDTVADLGSGASRQNGPEGRSQRRASGQGRATTRPLPGLTKSADSRTIPSALSRAAEAATGCDC